MGDLTSSTGSIGFGAGAVVVSLLFTTLLHFVSSFDAYRNKQI